MTHIVNSFLTSMLLLFATSQLVLGEVADVSLQSLQLSEGPPEPGFMAHALAGKLPEGKLVLTPGFEPGVSSYSVNVSQPLLTIRARAAAGVKMDANGTASGGDELKVANRFSIGNANDHGAFMSATLSGLDAGENVISLNVSDSGGTATRSYTVKVHRTETAEKAPLGLDDLQLSEGPPKPGFMFSAMTGKLPAGDLTVTPPFKPEVTTYVAEVSQPLVTVRARAAAGARMGVTGTAAGGDELTAGNRSRISNSSGHGAFLSVTLSGLAAGENLVAVEVTDPEGAESRRYRVVLTRVAESADDRAHTAKATKAQQTREKAREAREKSPEAREKAREVRRVEREAREKEREVRRVEREARRKEREARRKEQRARATDGSNDQKGQDLLSSIRYKDADGVRRAIEAGENVNEILPGRTGVSPLLLAVDKETAEIARLLIDAGADVNYTLPEQQFSSRSASGISALLVAVDKENGEIVRMLLSAGANVNYVLPKQRFGSGSTTGTSAVLLAVKQGNEEIVRLLVEAGANVNHVLPEQEFNSGSATGTSILLLAVKQGNEEIVRLLVEAGADVNYALPQQGFQSKSTGGMSALLMAVNEGHETIVRLLVEAGADVNSAFPDQGFPARKSTGGVSALMLASFGGHEEMARLLIEAGADVNYQIPGKRPMGKNPKTAGLTALRVAEAKDHSGIAELLRKAGAKR